MNFEATHPLKGRPLRIFVMADHLGYPDGRVHGGTTYFLNTLPAMLAAGMEVTVCFHQPRHPMAERLEDLQIVPRFLGLGKWNPASSWAFLPLMREARPDVLHLHSVKSQIFGRIAGRRYGIPSVVHVHDQIALTGPVGWMVRRQGPSTEALVGISDSVTTFSSSNYNVPLGRCHTVAYGFDPAPFLSVDPADRERIRREFDIPLDAPVIAVVGRVNADKGQDRLLQAMPRIVQRVPTVRLMIVGDGDMRGSNERLARTLDLSDHVVFTGLRHDVPSIQQAIDLSVLPSMWEEGFGLTSLEAMLCGNPVVGFRSGGVSDIVLDGETGLLVEKGDLIGLADAVCRLLGDGSLRRRMGSTAQEHAMSFTLERHVRGMAEIYDRLILERSEAA